MLVLGGSLKRKEDYPLAWRYSQHALLVLGGLGAFQCDGRSAADLPLLRWSLEVRSFACKKHSTGPLSNFPVRTLAKGLLRFVVFPLGKPLSPPSDNLSHQVATLVMMLGAACDG